jgi:hypothetical protein
MQERASRYAASAGSEEIGIVADDQEDEENQENFDDAYSPLSMNRVTKEIKKRVMTTDEGTYLSVQAALTLFFWL